MGEGEGGLPSSQGGGIRGEIIVLVRHLELKHDATSRVRFYEYYICISQQNNLSYNVRWPKKKHSLCFLPYANSFLIVFFAK